MNSVLTCFVGLYFATLANTVFDWRCEEYPARHGVMNAPFNFAYLSSSEFNILIQLKNVSPKITAIKIVVQTDDPASKNKHEWERNDGYHFRLCGELPFNKVTIGLELYSSINGLCATKIVSEGRHARILERGVADPTYESGHFCLNIPRSTCAIEMDLRNDCIESNTNRSAKHEKTFVTPKPTHRYSYTTRNTSNTLKPTIFASPKAPQTIPHTTRNTSITPTPTISDTSKATQNILHTSSNTSITSKPTISDASKSTRNISKPSNATWVVSDIAKTFNTTLNLSDTPTATWHTSDTPATIQNTSDTPNASVIGRNDAVVKKYTIAIVSAIFGMALIPLVSIAIWKRCWIKRNPSGTPELLSNDQSSPFYLNLLFRRECDQEIEIIEQHHYEEINLQ